MEDNKKMKKIMGHYGIIVAIINFFGFLLVNSGGMPVNTSQDYVAWREFTDGHYVGMVICMVMAFVIPTVLIITYRKVKGDKFVKRFINAPFAYSAFGSLGWLLAFIFQSVYMFIFKFQEHAKIRGIMLISFLNIMQACIFIFTLAFLVLNYIHRQSVLPRIFPEGGIRKYSPNGPSVRFIFHVFYLSVCIFPIFYLISTIIGIVGNSNATIQWRAIVVLVIIILVTVIIWRIFSDYFTSPLKGLMEGAEAIKSGDYNHRVKIVSSDDFGELADTFNEMSLSIEKKNQRIQEISDSVIRGMAVMVESRDNSTGGHINRTSDGVAVFVKHLMNHDKYKDLPQEFYSAMIKAAPMHDLGKIAVDDAVLRKPGKFTDEEYEKMKAHSAEGAKIVEKVLANIDDENFKQIAINVAHFHHEKWDGAGYPNHLKGEEIPLEARIMALADVFDALVSKRCYKESFTYDKAFEIIEDSLGSHFDPELGKVFIECRPDLENLYNNIYFGE